jgi:hypothetical protein
MQGSMSPGRGSDSRRGLTFGSRAADRAGMGSSWNLSSAAHARRSRERGQALVEFALILPILAMLLLGTITGGFALNQKQQMNHAVREGARYAATVAQQARADVSEVAHEPLPLPMPKRRRQAFLAIRTKESQDVITTIEVLSPWNKAPGEGRREYLLKRQNVFATPAHLVELDLLRGGQRMPMRTILPACDYVAMISRADRRPRVQIYGWSLRQPLPEIRLPLLGDETILLDLQKVIEIVYQEAGYEHIIDRSVRLLPPVSDEDAAWIQSRIRSPEPPAESEAADQ